MRIYASFLIAILLLGLVPSAAASLGLIRNFGQFTKDLGALQDGAKKAGTFMKEYAPEIEQAKSIRDCYISSTGIFPHLRAGLRGAALIDSKRGRHMICEGLALYQKYDPPLKRVLDAIGSRDEFGEISDTQIHRAAKGAGVYEVFNQWKKRPFTFLFNPWAVAAAYRKGHTTADKSLRQYLKLSKFLGGDTSIARMIRLYADLDGKFDKIDEIPFDGIRPPQRREPDVFDPIDYLNRLDCEDPSKKKKTEIHQIIRDPTIDF